MSPQRNDVIEAVFEIPSQPSIEALFELPEETGISAIFEINTYITEETAEEFLERYIYPLQNELAEEIERSTLADEELSAEIEEVKDSVASIDEAVEELSNRVEVTEEEVAKKVETVVGDPLLNVTRDGNTVTIASKTFVFEQATPSTEWVVNHNLNKRPSIDLTYYNGERFEAYREYVNNNQVIIRLENAATGYAYLN